MKIIIAILCFLLLPGALSALLTSAVSLFASQSFLIPFTIGGLASLVLRFILKLMLSSRGIQTLNIFEHELTHALVALLFLRRVSRFKVWHSEGIVEYTAGFGGRLGDIFITLAPYFLPTLTLILAFVRPVLPITWHFWTDVGIGLTLTYHTFSTLGEWSIMQPDITNTGILLSILYTITAASAIHGLLFFTLLDGYTGVKDWAQVTYKHSHLFYSAARQYMVVLFR